MTVEGVYSDVFITIEGPDGSGKTTQAELLAHALKSRGYKVTRGREPGGTGIGRRLREIILDPESSLMSPLTEVLLYAADRCQHVHEVLMPSLRSGAIVVSERYVDSSLAYQAAGLGVPLEDVKHINRIATGGLMPDLTILLDIEPRAGLERALKSDKYRSDSSPGEGDRIERREIEFHSRVRQAYLSLASESPGRFRVIQATGRKPEDIHSDVLNIVIKAIEDRGSIRDEPTL